MIDLTKDNKPQERLRAIMGNKWREKGDWIAYAEGDFGDEIGKTPVGKAAMEYAEDGMLHLFQRKVQDEPRRYVYLGRVR